MVAPREYEILHDFRDIKGQGHTATGSLDNRIQLGGPPLKIVCLM